MKTALIVGATGLIGQQLLQLLLDDPYYEKVKAITRKPLAIENAKLENVVVDFDRLAEQTGLKADDVFCCLGTTIRIAKTKEAFRKVDYEYPVTLAHIAKGNGATQFLLVSALGANKNSGIFYNRVKGEVEDALGNISFNCTQIFRPSLLLGDRTEQRQGEGVATAFFKLFGFLIPTKYKAIESAKVAQAMLQVAKRHEPGFNFYESQQMQRM